MNAKCVACEQVSELKKQVEQIKQQGDGIMMDDVTADHGDVTFRLGRGVSSDDKQKEKIRQIERQRREANDVSYFSVVFTQAITVTIKNLVMRTCVG